MEGGGVRATKVFKSSCDRTTSISIVLDKKHGSKIRTKDKTCDKYLNSFILHILTHLTPIVGF